MPLLGKVLLMSHDTATENDRDTGTREDGSPSSTGATMTGALPDADDLSQEEVDQIEAERQERTAPENRPEGAEVDNTDREFDPVQGQFTDSEPDPEVGPFPDPSEEVG
jgi:hypothetical protein